MVDKYSGHPKGFAYIEFADVAAANNALMLSNTTLRGRQIKVSMPRLFKQISPSFEGLPEAKEYRRRYSGTEFPR